MWFLLEILIEFGKFSYAVDENAGEVEIVLNLDGVIKCCSVLVTVMVEDKTTEGKLLILICIAQV